jgi:hypothetical protein
MIAYRGDTSCCDETMLFASSAASSFRSLSRRASSLSVCVLSSLWKIRFHSGVPMTALSILDLVRVTEDTDARGAFDNARDLAAHAETWGYRRIW